MPSKNTLLENTPSGAQQRFDAKYITSAQICDMLGVSRPTVMRARKRGTLPDSISVGDDSNFIWERTSVQPYLDSWEMSLASRKGQLV